MMVGLPIVGVAATELVTVIRNGANGFVDTRIDNLVNAMRCLLDDPAEARRLGAAARRDAQERFNIHRFSSDWDDTFRTVTQ
jgi:glycosyltransferase involved in cell wall biosynthesis